MVESQQPLNTDELNLRPPLEGRQPFDATLKRVLAMLMAKSDSDLKFLKCSPTGVLAVCSNALADIFHVTAVGAAYEYVGDDEPCSEVIVIAYPTNAGLVWVRRDTIATVDNAFPLDALDQITLTLTNLNQLRLMIATNGEKAIVLYTR